MADHPPSPSAQPKPEGPSRKAGAILIFALALLVYWPSLRGGFIWDDDVLLTENATIKASAGEALFTFWGSTRQTDYLPLTSTTLWLEWRLWGLNPVGYRLTNIFLHGGSALLLWRILRRLKISGAFLAALIFTVHPVCAASVAWIAERKNTLSMIFFLLSIFCWLRQEEAEAAKRTPTWKWLSLSFGSFVLALFSKGSVVVLPAVLLWLAWWQRGRIGRRDVAKSALYFAAALAFGLVTIWFQFHRSSGEQVVDRLGWLSKTLAAAGAVVFYFLKALWPVNLSMVYPSWDVDPGHWKAYVPLAAIFGAVFSLGYYRPAWGRAAVFASGYFLLALLPVLGFIDMYFLTYSRVADHWQYLAIIGVIGFAASGAARLFQSDPAALGSEKMKSRMKMRMRKGRGGTILAAAVVLLLGAATWQRAGIISDSERLWRDTLAKNPGGWVAHLQLGDIAAKHGQHDEAAAHFSATLDLKPNWAEAHYNLGNTRAAQGDAAQAASHFRQALQIRPNYPAAHYNLGLALEKLGRPDEALQHYLATIQIHPGHVGAHNNIGNLLSEKGQNEEAVVYYQKALQLNPNLPEAHNNLANNLQRQGKTEEAIPHYLDAIALNPNYADAHNNLAVGLEALGRTEEAQAHRQKAAQLKANR